MIGLLGTRIEPLPNPFDSGASFHGDKEEDTQSVNSDISENSIPPPTVSESNSSIIQSEATNSIAEITASRFKFPQKKKNAKKEPAVDELLELKKKNLLLQSKMFEENIQSAQQQHNARMEILNLETRYWTLKVDEFLPN